MSYLTLKEYIELEEDFELDEFIKGLTDEKLIDIFKRTIKSYDRLKGNSKEESAAEIGKYYMEINKRELTEYLI